MTPIKHAFDSPKSDGPDATVVRPSDWNAEHTGSPFDYVQEDDPGAVGAGKTWLRTDPTDIGNCYTLFRRMEDNDKWKPVGSSMNYTTDTEGFGHKIYDEATGELVGGIAVNQTGRASILCRMPSGTEREIAILPDTPGFRLFDFATGDHSIALFLLLGSADPSAGAGVAAALGSHYWRDNGEEWIKTSAPDTGWQQVALV